MICMPNLFSDSGHHCVCENSLADCLRVRASLTSRSDVNAPSTRIRRRCSRPNPGTSDYGQIRRGKHQAVLEAMPQRPDRQFGAVTTMHSRTRVRRTQTPDGCDSLPHTQALPRRDRNVHARTGIHVPKRVIRIVRLSEAM